MKYAVARNVTVTYGQIVLVEADSHEEAGELASGDGDNVRMVSDHISQENNISSDTAVWTAKTALERIMKSAISLTPENAARLGHPGMTVMYGDVPYAEFFPSREAMRETYSKLLALL